MPNSFWAGGAEAFADGLAKQYEPQLKNLRKLRQIADQEKRAELDTEIQRVEAEYKSKLDSINDSLF